MIHVIKNHNNEAEALKKQKITKDHNKKITYASSGVNRRN